MYSKKRPEGEEHIRQEQARDDLARVLTTIERTVVLRRDLGEFNATIDKLVSDAQKAPDASDRKFARRRILLAVSVQRGESRGGRVPRREGSREERPLFRDRLWASEHDDSRRAVMLYDLACAHARDGNRRQALDSLRRAVASGFANKARLMDDADLDSIRETPEFQEILAGL